MGQFRVLILACHGHTARRITAGKYLPAVFTYRKIYRTSIYQLLQIYRAQHSHTAVGEKAATLPAAGSGCSHQAHYMGFGGLIRCDDAK